MPHFLFLNASTREPGQTGNTETLARHAAQALPADTEQTWLRLADLERPGGEIRIVLTSGERRADKTAAGDGIPAADNCRSK